MCELKQNGSVCVDIRSTLGQVLLRDYVSNIRGNLLIAIMGEGWGCGPK